MRHLRRVVQPTHRAQYNVQSSSPHAASHPKPPLPRPRDCRGRLQAKVLWSSLHSISKLMPIPPLHTPSPIQSRPSYDGAPLLRLAHVHNAFPALLATSPSGSSASCVFPMIAHTLLASYGFSQPSSNSRPHPMVFLNRR